jgi:hypothetical protein
VQRPTGLTNEPEIAWKRVWVVPAGSTISDSNQYRITGRHEWVIPSDPNNLLRGFRAIKNTTSGQVVVAVLGDEETDYDYPLFFQDLPQTVLDPQGNAKAGDIVSAAQTVTMLSNFLIVLQSVGLTLNTDFPAPTQSFSTSVPAPPELTVTSHVWHMSDLLEEPTKGRDASQWGPVNITVTTDTTVAPDGTTTADKLVATAANGFVQNPAAWPNIPVVPGSIDKYNQRIWLKKSGSTTELDLESPAVARVAIRNYWRPMSVPKSRAATLNGGPKVRLLQSADEVIVWSASYFWNDDANYVFDCEISWDQPDTPWLVDHLRFQYQTHNLTSGVSSWIDHGPTIPLLDGSVRIGYSTEASVPFFPLENASGDELYDWRLVSVGTDGQVTEVGDPASVSTSIVPRNVAVLTATDFDDTNMGGDKVLITKTAGNEGDYKDLADFNSIIELTKQISSGAVTVTAAEIYNAAVVTLYVQVESGSTDDLDSLSLPEGVVFVVIPDDSAKTVNCVANAATSHPLRLANGRDMELHHKRDTLTVIGASVGCREVARAYNEGDVTEDLRIAIFSEGPASSVPNIAQFNTDGSGSVGTYLYWYQDGFYQHLFFPAQLPHARLSETDLIPHVHYSFASNQTGTYTVEFEFEYGAAAIDSAFPTNNTVVTITDTVVNPVANKHYVAWGSAISGTGLTKSSQFACRISRDARATNPTDTYPDDIGIHEFDFHFHDTGLGSYDG